MPKTFQLKVNGSRKTVKCDENTPLLYVLRNDLELNGPKFGCGLGQCGACTVLIDGRPTRSCVTPLRSVGSAAVVTLDGLAKNGTLHPLQRAFVEEQAAQCGYCTNGLIMTAKALLDRTKAPSEAAIKEALSGNLCRCGSHNRIVAAVRRASTQASS
jgi:nicotinate dehydrogenase subunit A